MRSPRGRAPSACLVREQPGAEALGAVFEQRGEDVAGTHQVDGAAAQIADVVGMGEGRGTGHGYVMAPDGGGAFNAALGTTSGARPMPWAPMWSLHQAVFSLIFFF